MNPFQMIFCDRRASCVLEGDKIKQPVGSHSYSSITPPCILRIVSCIQKALSDAEGPASTKEDKRFGKEGDRQSETFLLNVKKILRGRTGF